MSSYIPLSVLRTQSDARLVDLARGGHERAFEALVRRYRKPLLGYCRRMLLPEARAEDALQQGLLQAWLALREGGEVRDAKAWLYRIVHNAAISARRRSGYDYVQLDESLHGTGASASDIDRRIAVREALAGLAALPEAQREVLLRTAIHGHSHEQVATDLGLSDGAVRGLIYRARATLRAAATACTPPQVVLWAARAAESGSAHPQLTEIAGGAGSAGLLGALLKGGAVVASIGVLATGTGLVEHTARPGARVHLHGALAANGGAQAPRSFGAASAHLTAAASPTVTTAPRGAGSHVSRHHIAGRRSARAGTEIVPQRDGLGRDRRPATGAANSASQDGSGGAGGVRGGGARRELQRPSYDGTPGKGGDRGSEPSPRTSGSGGGGMDSRGGGSQTLSTALSAAAESRDARPRSGTGDAHAGDTSAAAPESTRGSGSPAESGSDH